VSATATVHRPTDPRPTLKERVAAMLAQPTALADLWCGEAGCGHPLADHDTCGCNHIPTDGRVESICRCTTPGGGAR
jgi:hypothetical protein